LAKTSFILQALNILGLEDILRLSEILHVKQTIQKKAAGEELIVWDESSEIPPAKRASSGTKVLEFPKTKQEAVEPPAAPPAEDGPSLIHTDLLMWQREMGRQTGELLHKRNAFKGYNRASEMYVVKESEREGKEKSRVVATNGVLVNKKQA
jgi:hypothetical protein